MSIPCWLQVGPKLAHVGSCWPVLAEVNPKLAQVAPRWPKLAPSGPQVGPKLAPCWPMLGQAGLKLGPCWPQVGPKLAHVGPSWSKLAQVSPKLAPSWPQVDPKLTHVGSSWSKLVSPLASSVPPAKVSTKALPLRVSFQSFWLFHSSASVWFVCAKVLPLVPLFLSSCFLLVCLSCYLLLVHMHEGPLYLTGYFG